MSDGNKSIGGWLLIPAIGLIIAPILLILDIAHNLAEFSSDSFLRNVEAIYGFSLFVKINFFLKILVLLFLFFVAILFFNKKSSTPRVMVIFFVFSFAIALSKFFLGLFIIETSFSQKLYFAVRNSNVLGAILACVIWIPYFLKSHRVAETFNK
ncbi:MAG TPA: DUF2569 family protein [archaeon]|nr:DUF2569 family protein [archaeon]